MSARFPPSTCFLLMLFFHVHASNAFSLHRRRVESSHPNAWTPSAGTFQSKVRVFQKSDSSFDFLRGNFPRREDGKSLRQKQAETHYDSFHFLSPRSGKCLLFFRRLLEKVFLKNKSKKKNKKKNLIAHLFRSRGLMNRPSTDTQIAVVREEAAAAAGAGWGWGWDTGLSDV